MHGWDCNMNGDRDVLARIVALLFALAGLADEAGGLPFLRRREMLGILCRGEAAVRPYFAGMAPGALSEEDACCQDDEPEECRDASRLAARFRALGFMLAALLTLTDLFAPPRAACPLLGERGPAAAGTSLGDAAGARQIENARAPPLSDMAQESGGRCPADFRAWIDRIFRTWRTNLSLPGAHRCAPVSFGVATRPQPTAISSSERR